MKMYVGSGQKKIHLEVMDPDILISQLAFILWVTILYISYCISTLVSCLANLEKKFIRQISVKTDFQ